MNTEQEKMHGQYFYIDGLAVLPMCNESENKRFYQNDEMNTQYKNPVNQMHHKCQLGITDI